MEQLRSGDPTVVGRYRIEGRLGSGGMGVVYLAEGPRGRVALKLVRAELGDDWSFRARFRREVQASFRVSSAHTARLMDFDTEADQPWMATEFVEGQSLDELVAAHGPLSLDEQVALASGLAQALSAIHEEGVVHRDLKPANVLLTSAGPKVIDFGIAAAADAARITSRGLMVGSPGWLAPEQIETGDAIPASDVFTLGLVLCFAASGEPPYGSGSTDALLFRAMNGPPSVPLERLARSLHPVVLAAVSRDPAQRPTPAQVLEQVRNAGTQPLTPPAPPKPPSPPPAPPPPPPKPPTPPQPTQRQPWPVPAPQPPPLPAVSQRRTWVLPAAIFGVLAVAGGTVGAVVGLSGSSSGPSPSPPPPVVATPTPTPSPTVIDPATQDRLDKAALLRQGDFPTALISTTRKDIFLPCNLANQSVPATTVLNGLHTDTTKGSSSAYVSQTVAVMTSDPEAVVTYNAMRQRLNTCATYPSTYQNNTDTVTISGPTHFGAGDAAQYIAETYTPQNYKGSVTSSGWVIARRGPVVFALYAQYSNRADEAKTEALAATVVGRIDAAR